MTPHPAGYPELEARYRLAVPAGAAIYEQGAVCSRFYVILSGRVSFVVLGAAGEQSAVREAGVGDTLGVVSAFTARPTSAGAVAEEPTALLAIPVTAAEEAFQAAPTLAVSIIRDLARPERGQRQAAAHDPADTGAEQAAAPAGVRVSVPRPFNEQWFFVDEIDCPACATRFEFLRVRASAVRPSERDTDFRIAYTTVDPTLYAVVVCPGCNFAAYLDDFRETSDAERRALSSSGPKPQPGVLPNLCGERSLDDAVVALDFARACYEVRGSGPRRSAGLLHRRAWIERERGDEQEERVFLELTRDAYREVYHSDGTVTEAAALRVAYLIGDLTLRLGDPREATRWLLLCTQLPNGQPGAKTQQGLMRMVRARLEEAANAQTRSA